MNPMNPTIVTHRSPDWDALGSVWLLKRYHPGLENAEVRFVNTGAPDLELLAQAAAVVDTGREFDPERLRFDHHQLPGRESVKTCAMKQVWEHLGQSFFDYKSKKDPVGHLRVLVDLVWAGDVGSGYAQTSRVAGIHAILSAWKNQGLSDEELLRRGMELLDAIDIHLRRLCEANDELEYRCLQFRSSDGALVAIRDGGPEVSWAAFESGARVVLFQSSQEVEGGTTHSIGLIRAGEWSEPHVGELVQAVLDHPRTSPEIREELARWFLHPAGFFAGRGTAKAPCFAPVTVDLQTLARLIDEVWER